MRKNKSNKRKLSVLVVLFAFLMYAILPFFALYPTQHDTFTIDQITTSDSVASLFGDKVLICTLQGFKWVSWEDLQNGTEEVTPYPEYQCSLCYIAASGVWIYPPVQPVVVKQYQLFHYAAFNIVKESQETQYSDIGFLTRAPPFRA